MVKKNNVVMCVCRASLRRGFSREGCACVDRLRYTYIEL